MKLFRLIKEARMYLLKRENEVEYWKRQGVKIGEGTVLYSTKLDGGHPWMISIGRNCVLTNCRILAHDASTHSFLGKSKVSDVIIGDNVFIGADSVVLCGVHIGDNSIIGAGSVVTNSIPENVVAAGNPAKVICTKQEYIDKHSAAFSQKKVWTTHYRNKSDDEKNEMFDALLDDYGYDA